MKIFYVYAYLREDRTPYYIGKGHGTRKTSCHGRVRVPADSERILIIEDRLTESEAFNLEIQLIQKYGRKDLGTGILLNRTNGGDGVGGKSETTLDLWRESRRGWKHTEETKRLISEKCKNPPDDIRKKMSEAAKARAPMTEETKQKLSKAAKGKPKSEETKQKMRKPKSEEHKKSLSRALKNKPKSDSHKKNLSDAVKSYMTPEHRAKLSVAAKNRKDRRNKNQND